MVLVQFIIYPAVALIMTELIAKSNEDIPPNMFVNMMSAIFAGMALILSMAGVIAEDIERKSLRFLVMAGVKPHEYLLGTGGFILLAGVVISVVFGLIGDYSGMDFLKIITVLITGVVASIILGATIGIISKNQQTATAIGVPIAVILGFTPMIAGFNANIAKAAGILYTQQLSVVANDTSANFSKAMFVIAVNIVVLTAGFIFAYRKKGIKIY
jgi:ABC-2 type transport system permease protein